MVAQHGPHAGVDGEPSTARASLNGEAGSAGPASCSTTPDSSLNSICLEDGLLPSALPFSTGPCPAEQLGVRVPAGRVGVTASVEPASLGS